jgi:hypothetical protein
MTPVEYNERLTTLHGLISGDLAKDTIVPAATVLLARIKRRIADGKNSADGQIGKYSRTAMYAGKDQFAKPGSFKPVGKTQDLLVPKVLLDKQYGTIALPLTSKGKRRKVRKTTNYIGVKPNFQLRKSMYLESGYEQLRRIQGMETGKINFQYRGDLLASYQMYKDGQRVLLGLDSVLQAKKREGLEKKFGKTFPATAAEKAEYIASVNYSLTRLTRDTIEGYHVQAGAL